MRQKVLILAKHPLIIGSAFLFVGSFVASILNYLFNLAMGRLLSVSDYGTFASLMSLFNILSVFSIAIMMVFTKFSASLVGRKKEKMLGSLYLAGNMWVGVIAVIVCAILLILSLQIANFLNIDNSIYILITIASLFASFLGAVGNGIVQGLLRFATASLINSFSSLVKLILGILFVYAGGKILGAIVAFFLSIGSSYLFSFIALIKYLRLKTGEGFTLSSLHSQAYAYAFPVFLSSIGIISFISLDIILVKHYFDSVSAGQYAALSLMGRSIFYVVAPISSVLFPLVAQKKERKEKYTGTLLLSIILIGIPAILLSIIYFLFPDVVLRIFFPAKEYLSLAPYLGPYSIFILFYCLSYLLNSFYLSIGKIRVFLLTIFGAVLEGIVLVFFHNNLKDVVNSLIVVSFVFLLSLLLYYRNATKA